MVYKKVTTNREKQTNRDIARSYAGLYEANIGSLVLSELYYSYVSLPPSPTHKCESSVQLGTWEDAFLQHDYVDNNNFMTIYQALCFIMKKARGLLILICMQFLSHSDSENILGKVPFHTTLQAQQRCVCLLTAYYGAQTSTATAEDMAIFQLVGVQKRVHGTYIHSTF